MKQRMRRISALLLVVLMCVSMVVPAFAAESAGCPGAGMEHTKSNCDYTQIGEPHEAGCGKQGYTAYQCNECGTYFADDFVESFGEHAWQYVEQAPTCTEDGFYKAVCLNCGEEEVVDADDDSLYKAFDHNWELTGNTCADGMTCTICGATKSDVDKDDHVWGKPELITAPNHTANGVEVGEALLKCEYCDAEKRVTVYCSADHIWEKVEAIAPTCESTGSYEGYKCIICGKLAVDANGTEYDSAKHEHAPCETIDKIPCNFSAEWVVVAPGCHEAGKAYKVCTMCGEMAGEPVVLDPTGHNYETPVYTAVSEGGMTAAQIAMFAAMGKGISNVEDYEYTILVKNENGEIVKVTGKCDVPTILAGDMQATVGTTDSSTDSNATYYVWSGEYQKDSPLDYDANGDQWMHWGTDCSTKTSYYTYVCISCDHSESPVIFAGHYFVEVSRTNPVCGTGTAGSIVYECQNPFCDGKNANDGDDITEKTVTKADGTTGKVAVKTEVIEAVHNYVTVTVAPTCSAVGYSKDVCSYCNTVDATKGAEGTTNGWYNVTAIDATAHEEEDVIVVAATCTTNGLKHVKCSLCQAMLELDVVIPMLGHDLDKTDFAKDPTAATCEAPGYNYYACKREGCNAVVAEEFTAQLSHSYTTQVVTLPNCVTGAAGYTTVTCKNCNKANPEQEKIDPVEYDPTNPAHHTGVQVLSVTYGTCEVYDTVTYQCLACEKDGATVIWTVNDKEYKNSGNGVGHTYVKVEAVAAMCYATGIIEHYKCSKCGALSSSANGGAENVLTETDIIAPMLNADGACDSEKLIIIDAVAPTCTTDGNTEGTKCSVCGTLVGGTKLNKLDHTSNGTSAWVTVSSTTHKAPTNTANCVEWGYNHLYCTLCGEEKMVDYVASKGGHQLETNDTSVAPTCCTVGWTDADYCKVCFECVNPAKEIAKLAHKNAAGEEFYGICTDTVEDRVCVVCKAGKDADGNKVECSVNGDHDCVEDIVKEDGTVLVEDSKGAHKWVETFVPATCMSYSYTLVVCEYCHYEYMEGEGFEYTDVHLGWGDWYVEKEATTLEDGLKVRECACGAKEEVVIPALAGLGFEIVLENGVKAGYAIPNNGTVNVTLKTNASDLDVWGIRLALSFSSNLTCTGIITETNAKFGENGVQVSYNNNTNTVIVLATAPNTDDGKVADVNLDGSEVLVTLQFKVFGTAAIGDMITVSAGNICEVNDKSQNAIAVVEPEISTTEVGAKLGDVVEDDKYDIDDAKALMFYVTGEAEDEYNSAADINQDGEVTATDFAALTNVLLGKVSNPS